jgi:hypothetical protein
VGWEIVGWKCWPYVVGQNPFCSLNHPMSCWTVTIFQRSRVSPPYHQWQLALPWLHDCPCWAHVSRPPSPVVAQIEAFSIGSPTILMVIWVFLCLQLEGLV